MVSGASFASEISKGIREFNRSAVTGQAYWYSRYNLGNLVMRSGMGETFSPKKEMMMSVLGMVNGKLSKAMLPKNPALIKRIYNSGDPHLKNKNNGLAMDFNNYRWLQVNDEKTTYESFGWTLIKEVEWSKQFNVDFHFGKAGDQETIPGAQQRFAGMVLCTESLMQAKEFLTQPGQFVSRHAADDYVAIWGLSDLSKYLKTKSTFLMSDNRCARLSAMMMKKSSDAVSKMFLNKAYALLKTAKQPVSIRDYSLAAQSLVWLMDASTDSDIKVELKAKMTDYLDQLLTINSSTATQRALKIRAMIEGSRVLKNDIYLNDAVAEYEALIKEYDDSLGVFSSQNEYTVDDVASLLGAFNSLTYFSKQKVDLDKLSIILTGFFESVINRAGLQMSAPPVNTISLYERKSNIYHRYPSLKYPPMAGGTHGIAPVFAGAVEINPTDNTFSVNQIFDTAGSMRLANEMIWFHKFEVNGFPVIQ